MSTFHGDLDSPNRSRRMREYSAYLDGELGPASVKSVERALSDGTIPRDRARTYRHIHDTLQATDAAEVRVVDAARARVYARLESAVSAGVPVRPWWNRTVRLPMPIAAAAAVALVALSTAIVYLAGVVDSYPRGFAEMAGIGQALNLQVTVDGEHTDELLRWLNRQEELEQVMIRLPDTAEFQMFGAPVLMRSDLPATVPDYDTPAVAGDDIPSIVPLGNTEE